MRNENVKDRQKFFPVVGLLLQPPALLSANTAKMATFLSFNPLSVWQIEVLPLLACGGGRRDGISSNDRK